MSYIPTPDVDLRGLDFHYVSTIDDLMELRRWLSQPRKVLGLDVETSGIDWTREKLRLVQFGDHTGGWAIPSQGWEGAIGEMLNAYEGPIVGHNLQFDLHYLDRFCGFRPRWGQIHDTLTMSALLDPPGTHKLKPLSVMHVSPYAAFGKDALDELFAKNKWDWATVPVDHPTYWVYGILDTCLTALLYEKLDPVLDLAGLRYAYAEIERPLARILFDMERVGLAVDLDYITTTQAEQYDLAERLRDRGLQEYGVKELGSMMPCVEAFLLDGVPPEAMQKYDPKTEKMKFSLDKGILEELNHPLAQIIREFRRARQVAGNFLKNVYEAATLSHDGFVHCGINQHEAKTHRMSVTRPALQQQPRGHLCRDAFVARDGHLLVSADFSNVEARLFANFAQELGMIDAIRNGIDLHCYTAMMAYGMDALPDKSDPRRQVSKNTLFGLLYGAGAGKIAVTAGIPTEAAQAFIDKLFAVFPGIQRWQKDTIAAGRWRRNAEGVAYVQLSDGRKITLSPADDRDYALTNFAIQGEAGVLFKKKVIGAWRAGLGPYLRLPVHDELVCEAPEDMAAEVGHALVDVMTDHITYGVPIDAEGSNPAKKWGDLK